MDLAKIMNTAASRHKEMAVAMVRASQETLSVVIPVAPRTTSAGATLFADMADPAADDTNTVGPFNCLWHDAVGVETSDRWKVSVLMGQYPEAKAYVVVVLEDVMVDQIAPIDLHGEHYFHVGRDVTHRGQRYKVLATEKHGMANMEPYLLVAVLAGEVRRRA